MREGTSGVWVEEKDFGLQIGYEDYGVEEFGGGDFERTYSLDKENSQKLIDALKETYKGDVTKMIVEAFGENFDDFKFSTFCKERNIKYSIFTWSS